MAAGSRVAVVASKEVRTSAAAGRGRVGGFDGNKFHVMDRAGENSMVASRTLTLTPKWVTVHPESHLAGGFWSPRLDP